MNNSIISKGYKWRRRVGSPFTPVGRQFCNYCKDETDAVKEQGFQDNVFAIKIWCKRCGKPMLGAVQYSVPVLSIVPNKRFTLALEWINDKEKITR